MRLPIELASPPPCAGTVRCDLLPDEGAAMVQDDPVERSLKALTTFLVGDASVADTLQRIIDLAVVAVPAAAYTGITMLVEDQATTSVFSDPEVREVDQTQYDTGQGPCLD